MAGCSWSAWGTFDPHLWGDAVRIGLRWRRWGKPLCLACQIKFQMCQLFILVSACSGPTDPQSLNVNSGWNGGYSEVETLRIVRLDYVIHHNCFIKHIYNAAKIFSWPLYFKYKSIYLSIHLYTLMKINHGFIVVKDQLFFFFLAYWLPFALR